MNAKPVVMGGVLLLSALNSWADSPGSSAADILKMSVGARAISMGEAYVAQADDVSSLYWNPAGSAFMPRGQASFLYSQWYEGLSYSQAAVGVPLEFGAIGGSFSSLNYGDIAGYDTHGQSIDSQNAWSSVGTLNASLWSPLFAVGVNAKVIQQTLADEKNVSPSFDLGGDFIYPHRLAGGTLRFGAVVQNLGPDITFLQQSDPLPRQWKVGLALDRLWDKRLNFSLDVGKPRDTAETVQGGVELWLNKYVALRGGYAHLHQVGDGFRAGIGIRVKNMALDYAYAGYDELGMVHRYELSFFFGQPQPRLTPEETELLRRGLRAMRQHDYEQAMLLFNALVDLEPQYKRARRLFQQALVKGEAGDQERLAHFGKPHDPQAGAEPSALSDFNATELERLLSINTPDEENQLSKNMVPTTTAIEGRP